VEVVRVLATLGANVDTPDNYGVTPAFVAAHKGQVEVVRLLAKLGAGIETPNNEGATPAWIAAQEGQVEVVRLLAKLGASVDTPNNYGVTPAIIAACAGDVEVVRVLVELGANVETLGLIGATPAYFAAMEGHANIIRLLDSLKPGLVTKPNHIGIAPLERSVDHGHLEATKTLLLLGAPVTAQGLRQRANADADARQLRADLQAWTADALAQHRTMHTFLCGCSAHEGIKLAMLEGVEGVRAKIGAFVGIVVGVELRRLRAVGPAIAAVDWAAHDEEWQPPAAGGANA